MLLVHTFAGIEILLENRPSDKEEWSPLEI